MIRRNFEHAAPILRHPLAFIWQALKSFRANQGLLLAGAVAYYALLSIVPLLIVSVIALSHFIETAALLSAVGALPAEQRSAFLMQAEGDLSVEEIALAAGVSFETAKSRLRYARAKLRQILWEYS